MPTDFITKRAHKKSRGGCKTCKSRKIKCDEVRPICSFCEKRNLTCEFVPRPPKSSPTPSTTTSSPAALNDRVQEAEDIIREKSTSPEIITLPAPTITTKTGYLRRNDMRAMHFWSLFTSQAIAPGSFANQTLQVTLPQLAFEHDYLLDVMLGISSLHLQSLVSTSEADREQTALYRARAFSAFREALPTVSTKVAGSWESALLTSILLTMLCAKDFEVEEGDLVVLHWINLYRGLSTVISLGQFQSVMMSVVAPLFKRSLTDLKVDPIVPYSLYDMLQSVSPGDPDFPYLKWYRKTLDYIGVLFASLIQDSYGPPLQTRVVSWCSLMGAESTKLAREKRPRMLVLLAHYMMFVKVSSRDVWWMEGTAEGDINRIFKMVPPRLYPMLDLPRKVAALDNPADVQELLLRSVDPESSQVLKTSIRQYPHALKWYAPQDEEDHDIYVALDLQPAAQSFSDPLRSVEDCG